MDEPKKATCPYCGRRVALTKTGKLRKHNAATPYGEKCVRSGERPN